MNPRKEVTNMYWFPFREATGRRPVKSAAAQSFRETVRVKGGALGSLGSMESHIASAVACWREVAAKAEEGGGDFDERRP